MKTKTIACCLAAIFLAISGLAQNTIDKEIHLKIYSNLESFCTRFTNGNDTIITEDKKSGISFGGFSPAISLQKENGNFHEIEISKLRFSNQQAEATVNNVRTNVIEPVSGEETTNFEIGLRYEASWVLKKKPSGLIPSLGLSNFTHYKVMDFIPKTSTNLPMQHRLINNSISVIPRVKARISERLFLDLNASITLLDLKHTKRTEENPLLPLSERETKTSEFIFLPQSFLLRIGLGLKI